MAEEKDTPINLFDNDSEIVKRYMQKRVADSNAPVSDQAQFSEFLSTPTLQAGSLYHLFNPKEIALANFDNDEKQMINYAWKKVINRAIYLAGKGVVTPDLPNDLDSQHIAWLNSTRAKDMEHEKLMVQQNINIRKIEETKTDKPSLFGGFKKK